jgi:ParD-like antitoxin of type II bacterial toxin-antitoxin system
MATTSPARIEDDLYASAKLAGDALSRSASQQIAHWARIGREIQASASISHREIADVLAGRGSYDGLDPKEQAVVRAEWAERMAVYREELDLTERFAAEGRTWVELADDGRVTERDRPIARRAGGAAKRAQGADPVKKTSASAAKRTAAPRRSTRSRAAP